MCADQAEQTCFHCGLPVPRGVHITVEINAKPQPMCCHGCEAVARAILAAGLGKRMDPLTAHHLPKPLFPLGGKVPMAEVWVRRLVRSGITDISMNLCVLADTIKRHFQDGTKFGAKIRYVEEDSPSGRSVTICG